MNWFTIVQLYMEKVCGEQKACRFQFIKNCRRKSTNTIVDSGTFFNTRSRTVCYCWEWNFCYLIIDKETTHKHTQNTHERERIYCICERSTALKIQKRAVNSSKIFWINKKRTNESWSTSANTSKLKAKYIRATYTLCNPLNHNTPKNAVVFIFVPVIFFCADKISNAVGLKAIYRYIGLWLYRWRYYDYN